MHGHVECALLWVSRVDAAHHRLSAIADTPACDLETNRLSRTRALVVDNANRSTFAPHNVDTWR